MNYIKNSSLPSVKVRTFVGYETLVGDVWVDALKTLSPRLPMNLLGLQM